MNAADFPAERLSEIQALYDAGKCRQAYELGDSVVPIQEWHGVPARILAGRIAMNLGAPRLAFRHHIRAYRAGPGLVQAQAYYLEVYLALCGPVLAWEKFLEFEQACASSSDTAGLDEGFEYLHTIGARICGLLRDFERAQQWIEKARGNGSDTPWLLVERATLAALRESWEEGLQLCRQALGIRPWYRPAVQHAAQLLHTLNRNDEALELLRDASRKIESLPVLLQLGALQMDLEQYTDAIDTLGQAEKFSPIADKSNRDWMCVQRCRATCALGDHELAEHYASQLDDDYHRGLVARLRAGAGPFRRVQLSVPFIQQFRMTCVPATLTMLSRFWGLPAEQVKVADAICYDGTPSHRARRWAEGRGMVTREFTADWTTAAALLDRGIPFAIYTTEATNAHVQVVVGYDELRGTFILRNPSFPQVQEVVADQFLKRYAATGPAAMVALPASGAASLEGLRFSDASLYDAMRQIQQALEDHRRAEAGSLFARMEATAPEHWLTGTAGRALHSYDTNTPALMACVNRLLGLFPHDSNLCMTKLAILRQVGRREERLEFLRTICRRKDAEPVFHQELAHELMEDARQNGESRLALRKAVRLQPLNASNISCLANLYWHEQRFDGALDLYRFATCLENTKEGLASSYFCAANARRKTDTALAFLRLRWESNVDRSAGPLITWLNALRQIGRPQEALSKLEQLWQNPPHHSEVWLAAADLFARHGQFDKADRCLASAEGQVHRGAFLRVKADLARYRTDSKSALALWREGLRLEPLSMDIHRSLVWVLAENEGRDAALKHLEEVCARFPHHYQLHQLWSEWARGAGPKTGEKVTSGLVETHPSDAWARRQLALVLADDARFEEALEQAEEGVRLSPMDAVSLATRAHVLLGLGQVSESQEDARAAIRLCIDYGPAIYELVNSYGTVAERRGALEFVEQELVRQVLLGDGLRVYRDAARLNLEPGALLCSLQKALKERPDFAPAWSVVVQQLAEMLQLDEALTLAQQAVERFPLHEQAWHDLALVQRLRLDRKGEQAALEQAMMISPASGLAARSLALFYERQGDIPRSKELLEEACARAPLDAVNHGMLAVILWNQRHHPLALERMAHALKVHPGYGWGWQTLGSWAAAIGRPRMAEELARLMVLQRPGEIRSVLVLARILAGSQRLDEALRVVEEAIAKFERDTEAHELRVEILAALGKQAEADAACQPEVWGSRPPANLRARRAILEAQRGNLASAIDLMTPVLNENPGFVAGWQHLADWLWQRGQHEAAIEALTNLRRLDPLNPVPLGYRASRKLQQNDRQGAKHDLERALKYDPAYAYGSVTLFDLQLEDEDLNGAKRTLELIGRYVGGEKAKSCAVKFRSRFLQLTATQASPDLVAQKQIRTEELDSAIATLREMCLSMTAAVGDINAAVQALLEAGRARRVEELLDELIRLENVNPAVGFWWIQRRIENGSWNCTRDVSRLCRKSAAARRAVVSLIESLPKRKRRSMRAFRLLWLAWKHRDWLRADNESWASMGYALVTLAWFRTAIYWMRDWRARKGLKMWMLLNLALALRSRRRAKEAQEVLTSALQLQERDHTFQKIRLLLSTELALAGGTQEAAAHFRELNTTGWSDYMLSQYHLTKAMLSVQQAPGPKKKQTFRTEHAAIRGLFVRHRWSTRRRDFRQALNRMARDTGSWWLNLTVRFD